MKVAGASIRNILVWDVPTRLFHWLLVASFVGAFVTSDSERHRDLHVLFGATLLVLIAFRLVWGVAGTRYARLDAFAFGPRAVARHLVALARAAGDPARFPSRALQRWGQVVSGASPAPPARYVGHTPAGSWAIWLMLILGVLVGATGAAGYNDIGGKWMEEAHATLAWTLLATVGVHVAGVVLSSVLHRENLVLAMITGRKRGEPGDGIRRSRWLVGAALAALVVAIWLDVVSIPGIGRAASTLARSNPARSALAARAAHGDEAEHVRHAADAAHGHHGEHAED